MMNRKWLERKWLLRILWKTTIPGLNKIRVSGFWTRIGVGTYRIQSASVRQQYSILNKLKIINRSRKNRVWIELHENWCKFKNEEITLGNYN
jgi:hypothetical protein